MDRHGRVVALLDATATFFEPAEAAFPGAGTEDWARAARAGARAAERLRQRAPARHNP
ncbi:hypothetical protein [Streptomyces goshikiensis]|uniref:hypothetical protein n=1 Tax=Streptomyces goshikiensis TaxID=1942 RepID=UPI00369C7DAE